MKKVLIICAAGMSSSLMAKKTTEYLQSKGHDIHIEATSTQDGYRRIESKEYDLYLVSPQTKMYFQKLKETADRAGKPIASIYPQAYIPIPMGIEKLANLVLENLPNA